MGESWAGGLRPAFTLFELAIVMSMVAVVAAIAIPRYSGSIQRYRADAAARRVVVDIARTQTLARAGSQAQTIEFRPNLGEYHIAAERSLKRATMGSTVDMMDEPYHARITSADFGGDASLTFNGFGVPDSGGTLVLYVGTLRRTVTVDAATGLATIGP